MSKKVPIYYQQRSITKFGEPIAQLLILMHNKYDTSMYLSHKRKNQILQQQYITYF